MPITLRDIRPDDEQFLLEVYASTRAQEMALVPWTDEQRSAFVRMQFTAQHSSYRDRFPDADYKVILKNGEAVGRIYTSIDHETIHILDITILPQHRSQGIGTALVQELIDEGRLSRRAVQIYVESFNPSLAFFERLGFCKIEAEGVNYLLEYPRPSQVNFDLLAGKS